MEPVHHSTWKPTFIYVAFMYLIHNAHAEKDLIFRLAKRQCCETNTFVFSWGEVTIMLLWEGLLFWMVLFFSFQSPLSWERLKKIFKSTKSLIGLKDNNYNRGLNFYMNNGSSFEHKSFISLWLSIIFFPGKIGTYVFRIDVIIQGVVDQSLFLLFLKAYIRNWVC